MPATPGDAKRNWLGSPNDTWPVPVTAGMLSSGSAERTSAVKRRVSSASVARAASRTSFAAPGSREPAGDGAGDGGAEDGAGNRRRRRGRRRRGNEPTPKATQSREPRRCTRRGRAPDRAPWRQFGSGASLPRSGFGGPRLRDRRGRLHGTFLWCAAAGRHGDGRAEARPRDPRPCLPRGATRCGRPAGPARRRRSRARTARRRCRRRCRGPPRPRARRSDTASRPRPSSPRPARRHPPDR